MRLGVRWGVGGECRSCFHFGSVWLFFGCGDRVCFVSLWRWARPFWCALCWGAVVFLLWLWCAVLLVGWLFAYVLLWVRRWVMGCGGATCRDGAGVVRGPSWQQWRMRGWAVG
uniref:Transmembrane protein n=1 Tax=Knipowitschia caucasica TaxID=637954 RepID=A0AAV2M3D0_KNICA